MSNGVTPEELEESLRLVGLPESVAVLGRLQLAARYAQESRGTCISAGHQHWTYFLADGTQTAVPVALMCWGDRRADGGMCGRPAHWDREDKDLHHDDPDTPPCDMAEERLTPCEPRE